MPTDTGTLQDKVVAVNRVPNRTRATLLRKLIAELESNVVKSGDGLAADHLLEARLHMDMAIRLIRGA